mmetsp:Transcript_4754/g.11357  ORF Transcript_4754/g.11357 Transcript_4754/m.11357 type:complete len:105 (-) Transcript_4754:12-326(-)
MCRPACRIIQTGVRSTFSPLAARIKRGSLVSEAPLESFETASSTALRTMVLGAEDPELGEKASTPLAKARERIIDAENFMVVDFGYELLVQFDCILVYYNRRLE